MKKMSFDEVIYQLRDLIIDRQSFVHDDVDYDSPFLMDIQALTQAIEMLKKPPVRTCDTCKQKMAEGYYDEADGEYYCSKKCLEDGLARFGGTWYFDDDENEAGGFVTWVDELGDKCPLGIYWTEWED